MYLKKKPPLEQRRAQILEEAKKVLIRNGKNTTMADIARALGLETSALYYYFKSIPEILNTALDQEYHDFSLTNLQLRATGKTPLVVFKEMTQMLLEFYYDNLEIMQLILSQVFPLFASSEVKDKSVAINNYLENYRETNAFILEAIKQAAAQGELKTSLSPSMVLQLVRGAIFGVCVSWIEEKPPRQSIPTLLEELFRLFT